MFLIKRLVHRGYKVVAFDQNIKAPGKRYCTSFNSISTWDSLKAINWLEKLGIEFDGAGCFSYGNAIITQQQIIAYFGLGESISSDIVNLCGNKRILRNKLEQISLSTLEEYVVKETPDSHTFHSDKYIIKGILGGASADVEVVSKQELCVLLKNGRLRQTDLIQEYLHGNEYRIASLIQGQKIKFLAVLKRENIRNTCFIARYVPVANQTSRFIDLVSHLIDRLNLKDAALKVDVIEKDSTGSLEILEVDFGIPGDYFEDIIAPEVYSYDYIDNYINLVVGLPVEEHNGFISQGYCFDWIFNFSESERNICYKDIKQKVNSLIKDFSILKIKKEGELVDNPKSNVDVICGLLHKSSDVSQLNILKVLDFC